MEVKGTTISGPFIVQNISGSKEGQKDKKKRIFISEDPLIPVVGAK